MSINKLKADVTQALNHRDQHLLRDAEVRKRTNIGKTKRRALILAGLFPAPIKLLNEHQLPGRTSYWLSSEIEKWVDKQVAVHRANLVEIANHSLNGWLNKPATETEGARRA